MARLVWGLSDQAFRSFRISLGSFLSFFWFGCRLGLRSSRLNSCFCLAWSDSFPISLLCMWSLVWDLSDRTLVAFQLGLGSTRSIFYDFLGLVLVRSSLSRLVWGLPDQIVRVFRLGLGSFRSNFCFCCRLGMRSSRLNSCFCLAWSDSFPIVLLCMWSLVWDLSDRLLLYFSLVWDLSELVVTSLSASSK